jgi:hypothetical protein
LPTSLEWELFSYNEWEYYPWLCPNITNYTLAHDPIHSLGEDFHFVVNLCQNSLTVSDNVICNQNVTEIVNYLEYTAIAYKSVH